MLNSTINLFKYPVAILFFLLSLELGMILLGIIYSMSEHFDRYSNFFVGMGIYAIMWFIIFRNRVGSMIAIMEHEFTHALFAVLSLNRLIALRVSIVDGVVYYAGGKSGGNWLITISPYFFSTIGVIIIGLIHLANSSYYPVLIGSLGYILVHHIHNTLRAFDTRQSDIQKVGLPFAILFLPSANLAMIIVLLSQIPNDSIHLSTILDYLYRTIIETVTLQR